MNPDPDHLVLDWQAVGAAIGLGLAALGGLRWYTSRVDDRMTAIETGQRDFREKVVSEYVRSTDVATLMSSLRGEVRDMRAELRTEWLEQRTRMDQDRALLQAQLTQIQESMARLSGDRRTRMGD